MTYYTNLSFLKTVIFGYFDERFDRIARQILTKY